MNVKKIIVIGIVLLMLLSGAGAVVSSANNLKINTAESDVSSSDSKMSEDNRATDTENSQQRELNDMDHPSTTKEISEKRNNIVSTKMQEKIKEKSQEEYVEVMIRLDPSDFERAEAMQKSWDDINTGEKINELKTHAKKKQSEVLTFLKNNNGKILNKFWISNAVLAKVKVKDLEKLTEISSVWKIQQNFEVETNQEEKIPSNHISSIDTMSSSDDLTWGLDRLDADKVWSESKIWKNAFNGSDVRVAVSDTGVNISHPDLEGKMATANESSPYYPGGWIEFNNEGNIVETSTPHDTDDHGTHVSGTVLGGNNSGQSIGVAPGAELMHALVLPSGSGSYAQVLAGLQWKLEPHDRHGNILEPVEKYRADVASMSWSASGYYSGYKEPVRNLINAGVVPVAAIGNDGKGTVGSPGAIFEMFAIGASNENDDIASFSSGDMVKDEQDDTPLKYAKPDFSAPGVFVKSSLSDGGWGSFSGTSMATPHVAGAVALLLDANSNLSVEDVYETFKISADYYDAGKSLPNKKKNTRYGHGIINADLAVDYVSGLSIRNVEKTRKNKATLKAKLHEIPGNKISVHFRYKKVNNGSWKNTSLMEISEPKILKKQITGLEKNTSYEYKAVAKYQNNKTSTFPVSFTTDRNIELSTLSAKNVTSQSADLKGEISKIYVDNASVFYRYRQVTEESWSKTDSISLSKPARFERNLTDLSCITHYEYQLVAVTQDDIEFTGKQLDFFTKAIKPEWDEDKRVYQISNIGELQWMRNDFSEDYVLTNDIDATGTRDWYHGKGFEPVGDDTDPFWGSFDGKNHVIKNLHINRSSFKHVGMFGETIGPIKNAGMVNVSITGQDAGSIGSFAGFSKNNLKNLHATGNISTIGTCYFTGLLAGKCSGTVSSSYTDGNIYGFCNSGGLVGGNFGTVKNCYALGNINSSGINHGGLVAQSWGPIKDSYAEVNVDGGNNTGGLVGEIYYGKIINSYYNIDKVLINGKHRLTIGGIFNSQYQNWMSSNKTLDIEDYSETLVPVDDHYEISNTTGIKDLLGFTDEKDYEFRLTSDLNLSDKEELYIPYFRGVFDGGNHTISNLHLHNSSTRFVGLFGHSQGVVKDVHVSKLNISADWDIGGVVGRNAGTVKRCSASGKIHGRISVGMLVGKNTLGKRNGDLKGAIKKSRASGEIIGHHGVGGLVGKNYGLIEKSYATADVTAIGIMDYVYSDSGGGLVGKGYSGTIKNCYATGTVDFPYMSGSLVGNTQQGKIKNSYATGYVFTDGTGKQGGLIGRNYNTKTINSFWDVNSTGTNDTNTGGTGKNTSEMKDIKTYTDESVEGLETAWDFVSNVNDDNGDKYIWNFDESGNVNDGYPFLNWQDVEGLKKCELNISSIDGGEIIEPEKRTSKHKKGSYVDLEINTNENYSFIKWSGDNETIENIESNQTTIMMGDDHNISAKTVDISDPTADAGKDKTVDEDTPTTFNGSGSSDNAGIVNYTWTIEENRYYGLTVDHTFTQPGEYTVKLNVTDDAGNYDTDMVNVTVKDVTDPIADAGENKTVDEDTIVKFDGSDSSDNVGIVNYTWTIEETKYYGVTVDYTFTQPGKYSVELKVTDDAGNYDTDIVKVTVNDTTDPTADAGEDKKVDKNTKVTFDGSDSSDNVGIVNYTWTIKGAEYYGVTVNHTFSQPEKYTVKLNVSDDAGNYDTDIVNVRVKDVTPPTAVAGEDKTVDEGTPVTFNGSGSSDNVEITNHIWTIKGKEYYGKTVDYTFTQPGVYTVELNVTDWGGNYDTDLVNVTVKDVTPPNANAGKDKTVGKDVVVTFNGSASSDNVGIVNYTWTIEDDVYHGMTVDHIFTERGKYSVKLNVTDDAGNYDTDIAKVVVKDIIDPTAEAGENKSVDEDTRVTFNASESSDNVGIVNYTWTIEGTEYYGMEVQHTFVDPGTYEVTLTVKDDAGNYDKDSLTINVNDITPPTAEAGKDMTVEIGEQFTLNASASSDNTKITSYIWTINGEKYKGKIIKHSFNQISTHNIELTVKDEADNKDSDTIKVTVEDNTPPTAEAGKDMTVEIGEQFTLNASASSDNTVITNYIWTINGKKYKGKTVEHSFDQIGIHDIKLTVTDKGNNQDSDTIKVTVEDNTPPTAEAGEDQTITINTKVTFNASDSTDNGEIKNYTWVINGEEYKGVVVTHTFSETGTHTVKLTVKDTAGNPDTDTVNVNVIKDDEEDNTDPNASFVVIGEQKVGKNITFDASNSSDNVGIVSYEWEFGDGTTAQGKNVAHTYDEAGNYTVSLTVKDEAGNEDTYETTISVEEDEEDDDDDTPGFTTIALLVSLSFVVLYQHRKKRK